MAEFKPKKVSTDIDNFEKALLGGKVIRYDGQDGIEIMERSCIPYLHNMGNIGDTNGHLAIKISSTRQNVIDAFKDLRDNKGYSVKAIRCQGSGCCQYTTYGIFIESE